MFASVIEPPVAPGNRTEPRLWIRRLAILSDRETIIRDVKLRPGLNIIWTPDMASSGALAHGSGKTTFCRLLRACLGESGFASDRQRLRIMTRLLHGAVAAEILIDGVCWVAVRPLGLAGSEFVVQSDTIEEAMARGRRDGDPPFINPTIVDRFFSTLASASPPEVGREHSWDVLRAWLTRDQECRLADILSWRSSQTQTHSRAQVLSEAAKLTMVRLALRAIDVEERSAAKRERELVAKVEDERRRHAYQQQRFDEDLMRLRSSLGAADDVGFDDTIDQKGLISLAEANLAAAMRADLPKPPDVGDILSRARALADERADLLVRQNKLEGEARFKRDEAVRLRSEANLGEIDIAHNRIRVCPICRVSIDEVKAKGCGISLERCDLAALRRAIDEKQNRADQLASEADRVEQDGRQLGALIQQLGPRQQALEKESKQADQASRAAQATVRETQDRVYRARRVLDDVRSLVASDGTSKPTAPDITALEKVRAQLDAGRSRARAAIRTLEERYQGIMAAWLPDGVEGTIRLDGHGLKVDAEFSGRGEVSTAALDSLKIVAFDLAALHMAVEERADLPPFLVHDSPREADLDGQLYARLFQLVRQWEDGSETARFQYIVTTTTAPPPELQNETYVRLRMSSTPPEDRLFGMDV